MTMEAFNELCTKLDSYIAPEQFSPRLPVPTEKRIAIALYKLASCAEYAVSQLHLLLLVAIFSSQ
ncbi:UNVERIFIED_CONTAM: hypothetical protein FKN15_028569 [Acipenser sinensis]